LVMGKVPAFRRIPGLVTRLYQLNTCLLYNIVMYKNVKVADVLSHTTLNIRFRHIWDSWLHLVEHLMIINLSDEVKSFSWSLTAPGIFSVRSLYADFMNDHINFLKKYF
jgi:hypothetical protein